MSVWFDLCVLELFNIEVFIVLGLMVGVVGVELVIVVVWGGGFGLLLCVMLNVEQICQQVEQFWVVVCGFINLNFFCYMLLCLDFECDVKWCVYLVLYYVEFGIDLNV